MKPVLKNTIIISVTAVVTFSAATVFYTAITPFSGRSSVAAKIDKVNRYIERNYLYDDYDRKAMDEAAIKGYVEGLNEPYTHYYSPDEFESYISEVEDSYVGIGVVISVDEDAGKIVVVAPTADSPAYDAGIKPGDYILAVDGTNYDGTQMNECVNDIKSGKAGSQVVITIEREGEVKDYTIERKQISSHSVESEMIEDGIGYVRINSFNTNESGSDENTYTEFVSQVDGLREEGMDRMIIDLRDNPGGVLDIVCDIADYLLPEGIITYTQTKTGQREDFKSDASELDIPIVVLINGNSASASEILTGALKDFDRAEIVGERSFGKGIVQTVFPFEDGSGMSMTIAKYYTPSGVCIHGVGIEPDYEVSLPEQYQDGYASEVPRGEDTQLNKALELLR